MRFRLVDTLASGKRVRLKYPNEFRNYDGEEMPEPGDFETLKLGDPGETRYVRCRIAEVNFGFFGLGKYLVLEPEKTPIEVDEYAEALKEEEKRRSRGSRIDICEKATNT